MKNQLRIIITFSLMLILFSGINAQNVAFEKQYGGASDDIAFESIKLKNGGYAVLGWTTSFGSGGTDYYLIKTDDNGNKIWEKYFGGYNQETGISIKELDNEDFLLGGTTRSFGSGRGDCWVIRTDKNGIKINDFKYGGIGDDYIREIILSSDGNYVFTGFTDSFGEGKKDILLVKMDVNGKILWERNFGGIAEDEGWSVEETSDGGYILGAWTQSFGQGDTDFYLIKTNSEGILDWEQTYGGPKSDSGISAKATRDGGYIFAGSTRTFGNGPSDMWVIKTDVDGSIIWDKTYGGINDDGARSIQQNFDGYVINGWSKGSNNDSDIAVLFIDDDGLIKNEFIFGEIGVDEGWKVNVVDNTVLIAGSIFNSNNASLDAFFTKIKLNPIDKPNVKKIKFEIMSNPCIKTNPLVINVPLENIESNLEIYTKDGVLIKNQEVKTENSEIDISNFVSGVYVVKVSNNISSAQKKIIVY